MRRVSSERPKKLVSTHREGLNASGKRDKDDGDQRMDRTETEKGVGEHPKEGRKSDDVESVSPAVNGEADEGEKEEGE